MIGGTNDASRNAEIFFKEWKNYCMYNPEIYDLVNGKKIRSEIKSANKINKANMVMNGLME